MVSKTLQGFISELIGQYCRRTEGAVAVVFGLLVPVVAMSTGIFLDISRAHMVEERLLRALDVSAMAAAKVTGSDAEIEQKFEDYFALNFTSQESASVTELALDVSGDELRASATVHLETNFMGFFGFGYLDISQGVAVSRGGTGIGLEVVLVIDNSLYPPQLSELKPVALDFVNRLFDHVPDDKLKIALVPFGQSVNVGPYGLGEDENGDFYGAPFVVPPLDDIYVDYNNPDLFSFTSYGINEADLEYNPFSKGQWGGCVLAHDYPLDTMDHTGPWEMYRYDSHGQTNPFYDQPFGSTGYTQGDKINSLYGANRGCPRNSVLPLSDDRFKVLDAISALQRTVFSSRENYAMPWAWRVISPEFPYREGNNFSDEQWQKVVVFLSNSFNMMTITYDAYGRRDQHSLTITSHRSGFVETCQSMKDLGVMIYVVGYGNSPLRESVYGSCATDSEKYIVLDNSVGDLGDTFEQIGDELLVLGGSGDAHISE